MNPSRSKQLFLSALAQPPANRGAWIEAACGDDRTLQLDLQRLLTAHATAGSFLDDPPAWLRNVVASMAADPGLPAESEHQFAAGAVLGDYQLSERLGAGGSATVWRARQLRPVARDVALKLLHASGDEQAAARSRYEAQLLARLNHPGLAAVYNVGTLADGTPWLALEYVIGEPLTSYARDARLPLGAKLDLFVDVCLAVQHAHGKGIVHRDLKPANVLVRRVDGIARPVVIDFGVAVATGEDTGPADHADAYGTPGYMSPEQASGDPLAQDCRSDVYALGVLLHELAHGRRPDASAAAASAASREKSKHSRQLTWVLARALDPAPDRRYATAMALGEDVRRLQRNEAVVAAPPARAYRTWLFARRHTLAIGVAAMTMLALGIGLLFAAVSWRQAVAAELRALAGERTAATAAAAEHQARQEAEQALAAFDSAWQSMRPWRVMDPGFSASELLAEFERSLAKVTPAAPAVELHIRQTLGRLHGLLLHPSQTLEHADRSATLAAALGRPRDLAEALLKSANAHRHLHQLAAAEHDAAGAIEAAIAANATDLLSLAQGMQVDVRRGRGDIAGAISLAAAHADAARARAAPPAEHARALAVLANQQSSAGLGEVAAGNLASALALLTDTQDTDAIYAVHRSAAFMAQRGGKLDVAADHLRVLLQETTAHLDADHPNITGTRMLLAAILMEDGRAIEAVDVLQAALPSLRRIGSSFLLPRIGALLKLAQGLTHLGRLDEAEHALAEGAALLPGCHNAHPRTTIAYTQALALICRQRGQLDLACHLLHQALADERLLLPRSDPQWTQLMMDLSVNWLMCHRGDKAGRLLIAIVHIARATGRGEEAELALDRLREIARRWRAGQVPPNPR